MSRFDAPPLGTMKDSVRSPQEQGPSKVQKDHSDPVLAIPCTKENSILLAFKLQFSLRTLLCATWAFAVMCGCARIDVSTMIVFGIPLALLGMTPCLPRSTLTVSDKRLSVKRRFGWAILLISASVCVALISCLRWGVPRDHATWLTLAAPALWVLLILVSIRGAAGHILSCLLLAMWGAVFVTSRACPTYDLRGGRLGALVVPAFVRHILPLRLRFVNDGPNSSLITRYAGERPPFWIQPYDDPYAVRYTYEKVDSGSIIFTPLLEDCLTALPSEEARRAVVRCLTSPVNAARAHQGLLLADLCISSSQPCHDSEKWWLNHKNLFHVFDDPAEAAERLWGLRDAVKKIRHGHFEKVSPAHYECWLRQCNAAHWHELGGRGGIPAFSAAYTRLRQRGGVPVQ